MRLTLNGTDYTEYIFGIDDVRLDVSFNDDQILIQKSTNEFTAKGLAYDYIKAYYWGDTMHCDYNKPPITGQLISDECDHIIDVEVKFGGVSICFEKCEAKVILTSVQPEDEAYRCLRNLTNFTRATGFNDWIKNRAYKLPYCFKLDVFSFLVFHFAIRPLIGAVFGLLCPFVDLFGGDCRTEKEKIEQEAAKCSNYLTAANLVDIFYFNCLHCGLTFKSNLLQEDPYDRVALLYQNGYAGPRLQECNTESGKWRPLDQLNRNVLQIWDLIKPVFNSRVRIKNGVAELERKDFFDRYSKTLLNVETEYTKGTMDCPEYVHDPSKLYAYGSFEFTNDPADTEGAKRINDYNDKIEWNEQAQKTLKGEYIVQNNFAPLAVIGDGGSKWEKERQTYLEKCDIDNFIEIGPEVFFTPKLVIVDPAKFRCQDCLFNKPQKGLNRYNEWLQYKDNTTNPTQPKVDLYNKFHIIDSPEYGRDLIQLRQFEWFPLDFNDKVDLILEDGLDLNIETRFGQTTPQSMVISFKDKSITIVPRNIKCK